MPTFFELDIVKYQTVMGVSLARGRATVDKCYEKSSGFA